ncbi:MAG: hypothetical protein NTX86_03965 [Candidatus Dependentiae bacterium]|nr:hypothetical protein [Candidatus Dependentiae bacterium]
MKKFLLLIIPLLIVAGTLSARYESFQEELIPRSFQKVTGRSFMANRPIFANVVTEQAGWHNFYNNKNGKSLSSIQITGAYQHSRGDHRVTEYFLTDFKTQLLVAGDAIDTGAECRDIRAEWLGLPSNFSGRFTVSPSQLQWAIMPEYNQDLKNFTDISFFQDSWIDIQLPLVFVRNRMNLCQYDVQLGTSTNPDAPHDIVEAFKQPAWKFGKIVNCRSRFELAAIILRMGKTYRSEVNGHQIYYYSSIIFPTGRKQNAEYLFDAVTGYNGHVGINAGVGFNILLNRDIERFAFCFFTHLDDVFLVRDDQCRTMGLIGREQGDDCCTPTKREEKLLSRFVQFNTRCPNEQNVPGVNVMTRKVRVKPFNMIDFAAGFRLSVNQWLEAEIGYGIWGHGQEELIFDNAESFEADFGIAGSAINKTANLSTIARQAPDDAVFTPVTLCDFDFYSASGFSVLNHKAYGSFTLQGFGCNYDALLAAGWFVEFPQKNGALSTWGGWIKFGGSM